MKETVAEIDRLIRMQGAEIRQISMPVNLFLRLAREAGITSIPDSFHYNGVRIRHTSLNTLTIYLKYRG